MKTNRGIRSLNGTLFRMSPRRMGSALSSATCGEQGENFAQALANVLDLGGGVRWKRDRGLRFVGFVFGAQLLAGAGDGESLFVEKLLDAENALDVALAVQALAGAAFDRFDLRKFGLPEAQHVGGQVAEGGDFADAEIKFVGDED